MMTIVLQGIAQGIAQGKAEGERVGRINSLLEILGELGPVQMKLTHSFMKQMKIL